MKFRAPLNVAQTTANGIGSLVGAFLNRDQTAQQAEMQAAPSFAQAAAAQAQARQADAMAGKIGAETAGIELKNDLQRQRPANSIQAALDFAGAVGPARQALPQYRETGTWGAPVENPALAGPPEAGFNAPLSPAQAPAGVNDQMLRAFMATLGATGLGAVDGGNSTADNLVGAARKILEERTRGDLLAGAVDPQQIARVEMAQKGTSPFAFNEYGVGNAYTGAVDASGPVAQRFGEYRAATTGAQQGNATRDLAAAGASNAQAGKYRAEADVERARVAGTLPAPPAPAVKPMPAPAVKAQNEELSTIGQFAGLDADLGAVQDQMEAGTLTFGPVSNVMNTGRNFIGRSTEESRNLASFKTRMENMRNAVLLLNKGVQTEGDAQRAMGEVMANLNDPGVVKQRLTEIRALNRRAVELRKQNVALLRSNFGQPELDMSKFDTQPAAANLGGPPKVANDADYNALPPGATYIAPDGSTRRKP
jgi:hypothetical protein